MITLEIGRFNNNVRIVKSVVRVQVCRNHPFVTDDGQEERDEKRTNHQSIQINQIMDLSLQLKRDDYFLTILTTF